MVDAKGTIYEEKIWILSNVNKKAADEAYANYNPKLKLIVIPAFNDLIMGSALNREGSRNINPLLRSKAFGLERAKIYNLKGQPIDIKRLV